MLFSKDIKFVGTRKTLTQKRLKLAHDLRSNRHKGVVPILLSTVWFILVLGISIEAGACICYTRDYRPSAGHAMVRMASDAQQLRWQEVGVPDAVINSEIASDVL